MGTMTQVKDGKMYTSVTDPFEGDAKDILEWGYGPDAAKMFMSGVVLLQQRPGQSFMNTLRQFDHDEYGRLTSSKVDPFYDDKRLPAAIDRLTSK